MTRKVEEERIGATDENGRRVTVIQWCTMIPHRPVSGPSSEIKGTRSWTTSDGLDVNYVDENTFEIVQTDMVLKRI